MLQQGLWQMQGIDKLSVECMCLPEGTFGTVFLSNLLLFLHL